jgi:hypothetical protein
MDLVGEIVISESMVVENPDLKGLDYRTSRERRNSCIKSSLRCRTCHVAQTGAAYHDVPKDTSYCA